MTCIFWRRLSMGLETLLGGRKRGFFIPYRYAEQSPQAAPAYPVAKALFDQAQDTFIARIADLSRYEADLSRIEAAAQPPEPRWHQDWFAPLDAAMLYVMIRKVRPAMIVEVGSGHSTRFAQRAVRDGMLDVRHVAIDPAPRADIASLSIEMLRSVVKEADQSLFAGLAPGDILLIDSSHILMPGTDVDFLINRMLPALKSGVIVHLHDIFLPDDYPANWQWRGYNEQLAVLALLVGGQYRLIFASHYVFSRHKSALDQGVPWLEKLGAGFSPASSLWLEKR